MRKKPDEMWLRRLGLQIAAQLPENQEDALAVLAVAANLVRFMGVPDTPSDQRDGVVSLHRSSASASSKIV
jgi:hypothetical protein